MTFSTPDILNASILIVDDQEPNVSMLEQLLSDAGYTQVESTMNPQEVCARHRKIGYDLILLDLQMPNMDGFQVMEGLKTNESDDYLPVIVLTAQPGHKLRALQAGAKDFISKPFDLVEVKTRIHNILEVRLLYKLLHQHNQLLEQTVQERTAELRESEARYRSLTELASDWYWEQDESGNFTFESTLWRENQVTISYPDGMQRSMQNYRQRLPHGNPFWISNLAVLITMARTKSFASAGSPCSTGFVATSVTAASD